MPWIDLPGGGRAHICIQGQRSKRCKFCNTGYVEKLCDFPVNSTGKTCDAGMCARCSTAIDREVDYCPKHKACTPPQRELAF
jgi:hypothetical protein